MNKQHRRRLNRRHQIAPAARAQLAAAARAPVVYGVQYAETGPAVAVGEEHYPNEAAFYRHHRNGVLIVVQYVEGAP